MLKSLIQKELSFQAQPLICDCSLGVKNIIIEDATAATIEQIEISSVWDVEKKHSKGKMIAQAPTAIYMDV